MKNIKMFVKSIKVYCLPISNIKKQKLEQMANEYALFYNYAAKFQPSLPDKYRENTNPSELYTKWIKSEVLVRNYIGSLEAFNAIKDACSNYKTFKENNGKFSIMNKPNIIKFENSRYKVYKTNNGTYGIGIGKKIKGKHSIFIPLKTGKYQILINHLENIIKNNENPGVITYNLKDNSISIPIKTPQIEKFKKKNELETLIGIDRGVNNTVVIAAIRKSDKKIIGVKVISGFKNKDEIRRINNIYDKRRKNRKHPGNKVLNIQNTYGHQVSSEIVKFTLKYPNPIVIFEKLNNGAFKKQRKRFRAWNYGDVKSKTEYKLKQKGIYIMEIDPRYTSMKCNRCGEIGIRDGIHFHCKKCNLGTGSNPDITIGLYNADVNAAINIALKGFYVLYEHKTGIVEEPIGHPNESIMKPIPTVMTGADGTNVRKSEHVLDETISRSNLNVMYQPMASVSQVLCEPENNTKFSSIYKEENKFPPRMKIDEKIDNSDVLSKSNI